MDQVLETERLLLVTPNRARAQVMADMANDRLIVDNLATMPHPYSLDDAYDWIRIVGEMAIGAAFAITLKTNNQFVGVCGSGPVDDNDEIDFGYWIGVEHWGNGYATEAAQSVLSHVFEKDKFELITTDYKLDNVASRRVLEKLGFKSAGERLRHCAATGSDMATMKMKLYRKDWRFDCLCADIKSDIKSV